MGKEETYSVLILIFVLLAGTFYVINSQYTKDGFTSFSQGESPETCELTFNSDISSCRVEHNSNIEECNSQNINCVSNCECLSVQGCLGCEINCLGGHRTCIDSTLNNFKQCVCTAEYNIEPYQSIEECQANWPNTPI